MQRALQIVSCLQTNCITEEEVLWPVSQDCCRLLLWCSINLNSLDWRNNSGPQEYIGCFFVLPVSLNKNSESQHSPVNLTVSCSYRGPCHHMSSISSSPIMTQSYGSGNVVPGPAASAFVRNWLEMQILGPNWGHTESETLEKTQKICI